MRLLVHPGYRSAMSHRILITGVSGYLGGTLLARLAHYNLPAYDRLYALVRSESQAEGVKKYGAEPLTFNVRDEQSVHKAVVDNEITVVFFLIDASSAVSQGFFIKGLAEVARRLGRDVHFLHVSRLDTFCFGWKGRSRHSE
jgi:uncharacterized protein YbjT (DUF2867 family)